MLQQYGNYLKLNFLINYFSCFN